MSGCPPGLQYLTMVDQLLIKQKVEILEAVTGFETANKYEVLNSMGQNVSINQPHINTTTWSLYRFIRQKRTQTVVQETAVVLAGDCILFKQNISMLTPRCFDMNITDLMGQEVIHLNRPLRCQLCCFPCCLQVSQELHKTILNTKTLFFLFHVFQEMEVSSPPGTVIGSISQQWSILYPRSEPGVVRGSLNYT